MSQPPALRISAQNVMQQFARRAPLDAAQFLYGEVALRMLQRLSYIRINPVRILDAGCGACHGLETLRARYRDLEYIGLDNCQPMIDAARERHETMPGLWERLRNKLSPQMHFICADMAATTLPPNSQDFIWSNMALHWHPEPHKVFAEWRRILEPGGLVMFSCLGPGSMAELRQAVKEADLGTKTPEFVDMHDFGDLLLQNGFADPVMDQEVITLTYRNAEKLLEDVKILGGNPSLDRRKGLVGRGWRDRLLFALEKQRHADGTLHLTLEVAYGHAWRAASITTQGETRISIASIGRAKPATGKPGTDSGKPK